MGIEGVSIYPGTWHSSAQALREHLGSADIQRLVGDKTTAALERYFQVSFKELRGEFALTRTTGPPLPRKPMTTDES